MADLSHQRVELVQDALRSIIDAATTAGRASLTADEQARVNRLLDQLTPQEMARIIETRGLEG